LDLERRRQVRGSLQRNVQLTHSNVIVIAHCNRAGFVRLSAGTSSVSGRDDLQHEETHGHGRLM